MRRFTLVFLVLGLPAAAEDWQTLTGADIQAALAGVTLDYGHATQSFSDTGETTYVSGRPSLGYWNVRGDQYCSVWPPSDHWACYDMAAKPDVLRFISASGDVTDGIIQR